jgi:hypothetical protein
MKRWLQIAEKPLQIRGILDKVQVFTEKTLKENWKKQSGPRSSAPHLEHAVELLLHRADTGAGDEPLGPVSWQEQFCFPSDFLVSGK